MGGYGADDAWKLRATSSRCRDFVIHSRGHAAEALAWTKAVMTRLGLHVLFLRGARGTPQGGFASPMLAQHLGYVEANPRAQDHAGRFRVSINLLSRLLGLSQTSVLGVILSFLKRVDSNGY